MHTDRTDKRDRWDGQSYLVQARTHIHTHRHAQPDTHTLYTIYQVRVCAKVSDSYTHALTRNNSHTRILTHSYSNSHSLLNIMILTYAHANSHTHTHMHTHAHTHTYTHSHSCTVAGHGKRQYAAYAGHHLCLPPESSANCNCWTSNNVTVYYNYALCIHLLFYCIFQA